MGYLRLNGLEYTIESYSAKGGVVEYLLLQAYSYL